MAQITEKETKAKDAKRESVAAAPANETELRKFKTTDEIEVPKKIVDQIIGQERAVEIIKKAASQRRNVLLLGSPGTGKSMLAQGMAELMPAEELQDVLTYPNDFDENNPKISVVQTYPNGLPPKERRRTWRWAREGGYCSPSGCSRGNRRRELIQS